jgi:tRNA(Ile)-lysidine synthase
MGASATPPNADPPVAVGAATSSSADERVAVAVSGGLDSTALLHCVLRASRGHAVCVQALHVHHGLQPAADDWVRHLRAQCRRWGVPLRVRRLDGRPALGESVEAWARRERYAALAALAHETGCRAVLIAHHRQDQAETVLLQLQRGGGARGLSAMPAAVEREGLRWLRPWLGLPRSAIRAYAERYRLRWVEDPSNDDPALARGRLRVSWAGPLAEHEAGFARAAQRAQEEAACLHALAGIDAAASTEGRALRVLAWGLLDGPRRANLLRHWFRACAGHGMPHTLLARLMAELPLATHARWPAPGGELQLHGGWLRFDDRAPVATYDAGPLWLDLSRPGRDEMAQGAGAIVVAAVGAGGIAAERLEHVRLQPRQGGERFQADPGRPARGLKKQYQMRRVPAWDRGGPLVFAADGDLLFVPGLGVDARAVAAPGADQCTLQWIASDDR